MELDDIPILAAMKQQMKHLFAERTVISENVANADTPGYRAQALPAPDFSKLVEDLEAARREAREGMGARGAGRTAMQGTRAGHISAAAGGGLSRPEDLDAYEENPDGNAVSLEHEMIRAADNQMAYDLTTQLYRKNLGLMKIALGKSK